MTGTRARRPQGPSAPARRRLLLALSGLTAAGASGAPSASRASSPTPARIVASFSILADLMRQVAPRAVEVSALVGPESDAHVYEPTPADAARLAQAGMVVVNGLGFEGWIERLVRVSGYRGPLVTASDGVAVRRGGHHGVDPHAWQDVAQARRYVDNIADSMAAQWPLHAPEVEARRAAYRVRLDALDAAVRARFAAIPRADRRVLTPHDAFGYFAAAYGVDVLSPLGWSTGSEASAEAVGRLIRQIRAGAVRAIFFENISDRRLLDRIAAETGARIGGTLYSDALSAPGGPADSYIRLVEHNARTIAAAVAP